MVAVANAWQTWAMKLSLAAILASAALALAGCRQAPSGPGAEETTQAEATCPAETGGVDLSWTRADGESGQKVGCFASDSWLTNGQHLWLDFRGTDGLDVFLFVRIDHEDALTATTMVFPGPVGGASISVRHGQTSFHADALTIEQASFRLPQTDEDIGQVSGIVTATLKEQAGTGSEIIRFAFSAPHVQSGEL
jgi:hypothetical protein